MNGWIKLHKSITEHWLWDDPIILKAWLDLLLSVNYSDKKFLFDGKLVTVKQGQIITSIRKLADRWKCSKERVSKILSLFQQDGMILVDKTKRRTLLTIVNYSVYQNVSDNNKDTNKDSIKDTDSPQHKNNKEIKNINKTRKNDYPQRQYTDADYDAFERKKLGIK